MDEVLGKYLTSQSFNVDCYRLLALPVLIGWLVGTRQFCGIAGGWRRGG